MKWNWIREVVSSKYHTNESISVFFNTCIVPKYIDQLAGRNSLGQISICYRGRNGRRIYQSAKIRFNKRQTRDTLKRRIQREFKLMLDKVNQVFSGSFRTIYFRYFHLHAHPQTVELFDLAEVTDLMSSFRINI